MLTLLRLQAYGTQPSMLMLGLQPVNDLVLTISYRYQFDVVVCQNAFQWQQNESQMSH